MAYQSARDWLETLEKEGELARVKAKVDWDIEIGAIAQEVFSKGGQALLFENIKDHENTFCKKLFTASLSTFGRLSLMLGVPKDTPYKELVNIVRERQKNLVEPVVVESGPVKENILYGDDIDLTAFPAPHWHEKDGGRYIGTFDGVVTKDPDTNWTNVGLYRRMIHDKKSMGQAVVPGQHIWMHWKKYKKMGKPMPIAMVNNWDPVLPAVSCAPLPAGIDEYKVMGGLRQAPVELVKCETCDIMVPASAEIVIEGEVSTDFDEFRMEGPFGEYTGYYCSGQRPAPVFKVKCITHRNDPILQGTFEGVPINEDHRISAINNSAFLWNVLDGKVPGVTAVNVDPSTGCAHAFIQINNSYLGQVTNVAACIWGSPMSSMVANNVFVFDEDIDIFDLNQVSWAMAYRMDYHRDIHPFTGTISPLDPRTHPAVRSKTMFMSKGTRVLFDCTKPFEWEKAEEWFGEKFAPVAKPDEETMERIRSRWPEYGIKLYS